MRVLSYNLQKHKAVGELSKLAQDLDLDVLCLQEAAVEHLPRRIENLVLADATRENRLGLAIYFCEDRLRLDRTQTYKLRKSLHDRTLAPAHERLLAAAFTDLKHQQPFIAASFHASPLTTMNSLRRDQINTGLTNLKALADVPTVMIGDYNYPWFIKGLTRRLAAMGYQLHKGDSRTYTRYGVFRGYYDFAVTRDMDVDSFRTLPQGMSDHMPVLLDAHVHDVAKTAAA